MTSAEHVELLTPRDLDEALGLKVRYGENGRFVAGGTDLLLKIHAGVFSPGALIRLPVPSADPVTLQHGMARVCALTPVARLAASSRLNKGLPLLAKGLQCLGSPQIRNAATIGGNLGNASPCCDCGPPLLVYGARVVLRGPDATRQVPIADFFTGPGATVLKHDELIEAVLVPVPQRDEQVFHEKFGPRGANVIASANFAARVHIEGRRLDDVLLAAGSVAPTPVRLTNLEQLLVDCTIPQLKEPDTIDEVNQALDRDISPITDVRGSLWYKGKVIQLSVHKMLEELKEERDE